MCQNEVVSVKYPENKARLLVFGKDTYYYDVPCTDARINENLCGEEANYYRPKIA